MVVGGAAEPLGLLSENSRDDQGPQLGARSYKHPCENSSSTAEIWDSSTKGHTGEGTDRTTWLQIEGAERKRPETEERKETPRSK